MHNIDTFKGNSSFLEVECYRSDIILFLSVHKCSGPVTPGVGGSCLTGKRVRVHQETDTIAVNFTVDFLTVQVCREFRL